MRKALETEGIPTPEVADEILHTLRRQGYIDDRRMAARATRYLIEHTRAGPHRVRSKLRAAGIDEDLIEEQVTDAYTAELELEMAEELARGAFKAGEGRERRVRRINGLLSRRGYNSGVVNSICARILRGSFDGEDDERTDTDGA